MNQSVININGRAVERIEYQGVPVITLPMMDELHERPTGTAGRNFRQNKAKLIAGEDYFVANNDEMSRLVRRNSSDQTAKRGGHRGDYILLAQTGYAMLVKSFTDDLSWTVQRTLVNSYFSTRQDQTVFDRRVEVQHLRRTMAPGGLAIDYRLDLTKIVMHPTRDGLAILERLTGIPMDDILADLPDPKANQFVAAFESFYAAYCTLDPTAERILFKEVWARFIRYATAASYDPALSTRRKMFSRAMQAAGHAVVSSGGAAYITRLRLSE
jgi:hypothetical protein